MHTCITTFSSKGRILLVLGVFGSEKLLVYNELFVIATKSIGWLWLANTYSEFTPVGTIT